MTENEIWRLILALTSSAAFTAALMGNLYAESGLRSNNLQQTYEQKLHESDVTYTAKVDDGTFSRDTFVHDSAGYGLVQWTYYSRKQGLYDYWKQYYPKRSIGDCEMQIMYCHRELQWYDVYKAKDKSGIDELTVRILKEYEAPADTGAKEQAKRIKYAHEIYDRNINKGSTTHILEELDTVSQLIEEIRKEVKALD